MGKTQKELLQGIKLRLDKLSVYTSKLSLLVTLLTVTVLFLTLLYEVLLNERGPVWGVADPHVSIGRQVIIRNSLWGWTVELDLYISNLGTKAFQVGEMEVYMSWQREGEGQQYELPGLRAKPWYSSEFEPLGHFAVEANSGWKHHVSFTRPAEDMDTLTDLNTRMLFEVVEQYFAVKNGDLDSGTHVYEISEELYQKVQERIAGNVAGIKAGDYRLLLSIPRAGKEASFICRRAYRFRLQEADVRLLQDLQARWYRFPYYAPGNWSLSVYSSPPLTELHGEEAAALIREADAFEPPQ